MRSTILSENQYEKKFVTTAKRKPMHQTLRAAERFADEQQQRAERAEQKRRLDHVGHDFILRRYLVGSVCAAVVFAALGPVIQTGDQARDERRAIGERINLDVLVERVRAVADRPEPV